MSFRLKKKEKVAEGLRRILAEERQSSVLHLAPPPSSIHHGIHEARKCLKRSRAVLRIVRSQSRGKWVRAENRRLRGAGRELSELRDLHAAVEATRRVLPSVASTLPPGVADALEAHVRARRDLRFADEEAIRRQLRRALERVLTLEDPLPSDRLRSRGLALVIPGLVRARERATDAFHAVLDRPDTRQLHELRKRVKDLGYGLRMWRRCEDEALQRDRRRLEDVAELLGQERDLSLLRELLLGRQPALLSARARRALRAELDRQQAQLRVLACDGGELVLSESSRRFGRRLEAALRHWRSPAS